MTDKQPEALRLAHALCNAGLVDAPLDSEIAAELRRQHALIAELVDALRKITCQTSQARQLFAIRAGRVTLSKAEAQQ